MSIRSIFVSLVAIGCFLAPPPPAAADSLPAGFTAFQTDLASASFWANARGADNSIAKKSVAMVNAAFATSANTIALNVAPNKYLTDSDDQSYCARLSSAYSQSPLKFGPKTFATVDAFSNWFSQLSQGNGNDGALLYQKCDQDCSPSYQVVLSKSGSGYAVNVVTACNQPRDKDDNQYVLTSGTQQ